MARRKQKRVADARQANMKLNPGRRTPSTRVRGSLTGVTSLSGNESIVALNTASTAGRGGLIIPMIGGCSVNRVNSSIARVGALYSNYKYLPGTTFHWSPTVGTTTSGAVHICYVDNPEVLKAAYILESTIGTSNDFMDFVRSQSNTKTYAVWESFTMAINPVTTRKMFNVNSSLTLGPSANTEELARCAQGAFLIALEGGPLTDGVSVGRPWVHVKIFLEGLRGTVNT